MKHAGVKGNDMRKGFIAILVSGTFQNPRRKCRQTGISRSLVSTAVLLALISLVGNGCSKLSGISGSDEAMAVAEDALAVAQKANSALDDGSGSGTTMGDELAEAQQAAEDAQAAAEAAQLVADDAVTRLEEVENRLSAICANAPNACY